ncbi:MAG TPA: signal peptidase II [Polyangia bacterium]
MAVALACAAGLFGADVGTKTWAEYELRRQGQRSLFGGSVVLRYQTNSGMAFGIARAPIVHWKRHALIAYATAVTAGVLLVLGRRLADPNVGRHTAAGLVAILAGAAGNLRDRIMRGGVIDFIDIQPPGGVPWPAFNLADLYLAVGLVLCCLGLWRAYRRFVKEPAAPST